MILINGRKIQKEVLEELRVEVMKLNFQPVFCDVLVGSDPASVQYVGMKAQMAERVGIHFHHADFPSSITTEELVKEIKVLNKIKNMCGIIIQLPLPEHLDKHAVLDAIDSDLDVDCLGKIASEKFYQACLRRQGEPLVGYPTALASMALLDSLNLDLSGKNIVVLGQGMLVGKPVSALLRFRGLDHITITSKTPARNAYGIAVAGGENKAELIKNADVIISGMGHGKYITGEMIKAGAVLIDAGTSESEGGIVGDIDLESVKDIAGFVSPVPGGVGPVTVAMLLKNVLIVANKIK